MGKPVFSNGPISLTRNPLDYTILDSWVFDNFVLADKLFANVLRNFQTFPSVNFDLFAKLVSSE